MKAAISFNCKKNSDKSEFLNSNIIYTEKWEEDNEHDIGIFSRLGEKFINDDGDLDLKSCLSFFEGEKWGDICPKNDEDKLDAVVKYIINEDCTFDIKHKEDTYKRKIFPEELVFNKKYGDKRQWFFDSIENYFLENQGEIPEKINKNKINEKRKVRYDRLISLIEEKKEILKSDNAFNKVVVLPALDLMLNTTKQIFSGKDYNLSLGKRVLRLIEVIEDDESNFESKNNCDFYFVTCYLKKL